MNEEQIADTMRGFVKAMADGDVETTLGYFDNDAVYTDPYGTYVGKAGIRQELTGMARNIKDMKVEESGNGIIAKGDRAFFEHVLSGHYHGKHFEMLAVCAYEFRGEKIHRVRSVYDRLLVAKETASGWPARPMVNTVVRQTEKAMR